MRKMKNSGIEWVVDIPDNWDIHPLYCFFEERINKNKVKMLIVAEDASQRTKDKFNKIAKEKNVPIIIKGDIELLSKTIGKSNKAIIGIEDINLSNEIQRINNGGEIIG